MADSHAPSSARGTDRPIYPKAFFAKQPFSKERDRVFVIMPFSAPHSETLRESIRRVCRTRRLNLRRGDDPDLPNLVLTDILTEIEEAEIIVADLTGLNANVLYETGIAHTRSESVIMIAQEGQELPFNLKPFRCIFFDLSSSQKTRAFEDQLGRAIEAIRDIGRPVLIDDPLERTHLLVGDLRELLRRQETGSQSLSVWTSASLSAFAIGPDETYVPKDRQYHMALLNERQALLEAARKGCSVKCIITPPYRNPLLQSKPQQSLLDRMTYLLAFLKSGDTALDFIEWAISPYRQKNLYIIDHIAYIEGFKEATERGFGLSLRQTNQAAIVSNIEVYEALFSRMISYTITNYYKGKKPRKVNKDHLREAAINCVEGAIASWT